MSPSSRLPTLLDVANEAGVSLATASRTLNGSTRTVNGDYRDRVLTAAAQLGYTPNLSAQAVAKPVMISENTRGSSLPVPR